MTSSSIRALLGSLLSVASVQFALVITGTLTARFLGPEQRGYWALFLIISAVSSQLVPLGTPAALAFFLSRAPGTERELVRALLPVIAVQLLFAVAITALISRLVLDQYWTLIGRAAIVAIPSAALAIAHNYALSVLQGLQRFTRMNILRSIPSLAFATLLLVVFASGHTTLLAASSSWTAGVGVAAIISTTLAYRSITQLPYQAHDKAPSVTSVVTFGLKGMLGSISPVESLRLDQALVGFLLTPVQLGFYAAAIAFTNAPRLACIAVSSVAYPVVASSKTMKQARAISVKYILVAATFCAMLWMAITLAAPLLVSNLLGDSFLPSVQLVPLLLTASTAYALRRLVGDFCRAAGKPAIGTYAELFMFSMLVLLSPVVALTASVRGAAYIMIAASMVTLFYVIWSFHSSIRDPNTETIASFQAFEAKAIGTDREQSKLL